jgi:hypothetical protein
MFLRKCAVWDTFSAGPALQKAWNNDAAINV